MIVIMSLLLLLLFQLCILIIYYFSCMLYLISHSWLKLIKKYNQLNYLEFIEYDNLITLDVSDFEICDSCVDWGTMAVYVSLICGWRICWINREKWHNCLGTYLTSMALQKDPCTNNCIFWIRSNHFCIKVKPPKTSFLKFTYTYF